MNYLQVKNQTLQLLDEISSSGAYQTTQDVVKKIPGLINDALMDLAEKVKLSGVLTITRTSQSDPTEYDLPIDWLKLDTVLARSDATEPLKLFNAYYLLPNRKIVVADTFCPITISAYYWRSPLLLSDSPQETDLIDTSESAARIIAYFVAGRITLSEGQDMDSRSKGNELLSRYERKRQTVIADGIDINSFGVNSVYSM